MELWKVIPNYNRYEVSTDGKVRSNIKYGDNQRVLKQTPDKDGYLTVHISSNNKKLKLIRVHRLLMITFKPIESYQSFVVNHIDGIKNNNKIDNLEWCTVKQNNEHAIGMGLSKHVTELKEAKINYETAQTIRKEYIPRIVSRQKLANKYGLHKSHIDRILANTTWKNY